MSSDKPGFKKCPQCLVKKPLAEFYPTLASRDGRTQLCRVCIDAADPDFAEAARSADPHAAQNALKPHLRWRSKNGPILGGRECYPPEFIRELIRSASQRETPWIETCSVFGCYEPAERHHISYAHPHLFIWLCRQHHAVWHQTVRAMFRQFLDGPEILLPPELVLEARLNALQRPSL